MKGILIALIGVVMTFHMASAAVQSKAVEYKDGDSSLEGYLAYDDSFQGQRPGVLVFPEWTGLGKYAKSRAEQLAKLGYVAFAVDMYGKGVRPKDTKEAGQLAGKFYQDRQLMRRRAQAGLEQLRKSELVNQNRIAAIGYCFGGSCALELGRSGADIQGIVSFHGNPDNPNPEDDKNIKGKVLLLHGGSDPNVSIAKVDTFISNMTQAGKDFQVVVYSGAVHGFTNPDNGNDPSKGVAYNETADRRSWQAMQQFFAEIFGDSKAPRQ